MAERKNKESDSHACRPNRREVPAFSTAGLGAGVLGACRKGEESPASAASGLKTVRPRKLEGVLNNPWMGWGLWAGPVYFDGTPRTLEENPSGFGDDAALFDTHNSAPSTPSGYSRLSTGVEWRPCP